MVDESVEVVVRRYLEAVHGAGIRARRGVLFGSSARGGAHEWSDIDLIVIAPELEAPADRRLIAKLWELRAVTDPRIEPIPCGEREWETDDTRPILDIPGARGLSLPQGSVDGCWSLAGG